MGPGIVIKPAIKNIALTATPRTEFSDGENSGLLGLGTVATCAYAPEHVV